MSLKKFSSHLKHGWRHGNTNDTDDSDLSSDSDSTVQYIHNFLSSHSKTSDPSATCKNWSCTPVGLPPVLGCEHAHSPFHPIRPTITNSMAMNPATSSNYHLMHHDYAERMNEQLTRDTFNSNAGDLLDFGVRSDGPRSTDPDKIDDSVNSDPPSPPEVTPYEVPVATPLNLGKCPLKKRPWLMPTDNCSKETGKSQSTLSYDVPCSSQASTSDVIPPSLPQWSTYRGPFAPPLLTDVMSAAAVPSSLPSTELPSSPTPRDRLKLRLKRINLSEASSSPYTPYACTLSHSMHNSMGSNIWSRPREKTSLYPSLSMSPDQRMQTSTTSQPDPVIDDSSPEIQFISMEQPSVGQSSILSRVSERMKRRKRRRMHVGMLGKTYVSDEVIVVDDSHQEQDGTSQQLPYKASVSSPATCRKLNSSPDRNTLALPCSSSTVTESASVDNNVEMQDVTAVSDSNVEMLVGRESPDGGSGNSERSTTPDSIVSITPVSEGSQDESTPVVNDSVLDRGAVLPATSVPSSSTVPVQVAPTMMCTTVNLSFGSATTRPASQGPSDVDATQAPLSLARNLSSGLDQRGLTEGEAVQPMLLDATKATGDSEREVKDMGVGAVGQLQHDDRSTESKPTIRVKDMFKDEPMFSDTVNRLKTKLMSLTAILECPVCLEYVGPPIYQCRRGHIVCGLCKPKLMYCPTCRSGFSEYRNLIAEMFAERLDYPCKNAHLGCESTFTLKDKEDHEANCAFRFYKCILCPWKGLHSELLPHLMRDHPGKVGHGAEQEILLELGDMTASANQNWIVSAMNEMFRVNFILAKRQSNMQIMGSVQFIGPRRRADDFIYTFEVKSEEFDQHCIFSRKTHSDLDKCYTYYTNGDGFFINNSVLFSSGEEGNKCILVKLVIKKKIV